MTLGTLDSTTEIITGVAFICAVVALVLGLAGRRRAWPGYLWVIGGLLIQLSAQLIVEFADDHDWPHNGQLAVDMLGITASVVLLACLAKAASVRAKSRG